jgi:hypothetical protein
MDPLVIRSRNCAGVTCAARRTAAFDRLAGGRRDHDAAAHAEVDAQLGPGWVGLGRAADAGGLAPHRLAAPVSRGERASGQRGTQLAGGVRPAHERVGVVDIDDAAMQGLIGDQAASGLDLGKFRHLLGPVAR